MPPSLRRQNRRRKPAEPPRRARLTVDALGRHGDGLATLDDKTVYVPFTLAGETVEAEVRGERATLVEVVAAAADRVPAPCPHFGTCGGCAVQHLAADAYAAWKRGLVATALARRGIDADVAALIDAHGAGRRRVVLHVERGPDGLRIGFTRPRRHEVLAVAACPILDPALAGVFDVVHELARVTGATRLDVAVTATETGLDANLRGAGPPNFARLASVADELDLARLCADGDVVVERRPPSLTMGPARVVPPPGGFLQATAAGELALAGLVTDFAAGASRLADLFCGVGPFALRLAPSAAVLANDADAALIAALDRANRHTTGLKPLTAEVRDLFRDPLAAVELNGFDAVVFDPPRAGAEAQARELAASNVSTVIGVSCDPATFARDAAILVDGGYALERVVPVDQFKYAAHVEIVGMFRRS